MRYSTLAVLMGAACALAACALNPWSEASPRPQCETIRTTIYFAPEDEMRAPATGPIINDITERVAACKAAGGRVRHASIVAYPDTDVPDDFTARKRGEAVRRALVNAGVPEHQITLVDYRRRPENPAEVMRRRAEIEVRMR